MSENSNYLRMCKFEKCGELMIYEDRTVGLQLWAVRITEWHRSDRVGEGFWSTAPRCIIFQPLCIICYLQYLLFVSRTTMYYLLATLYYLLYLFVSHMYYLLATLYYQHRKAMLIEQPRTEIPIPTQPNPTYSSKARKTHDVIYF